MTKRKRKDVSQRKKKQKASRSSTITLGINTALHSFAATTFRPLEPLKRELRRMIGDGSKAVVLASWLVNLYLAWIPESDILADPSLVDMDQNLCLTALSLVSDTGLSDARKANTPRGGVLQDCFLSSFKSLFPPDFAWPALTRSGNTLHNLAKEMQTNYKVYLDTALHQHVARYLKAMTGASKSACRRVWNLVLDGLIPPPPTALTPLEQEALFAKTFLDKHPLLLRRWILAQPVEMEHFSLFPLRTIRTHFVVFDEQNLKAWGYDECAIEAFFPRRAGWEPGRQVKTDGVRVCLTYTKPKVIVAGRNETMKAARRTKQDEEPVDLQEAPNGIYTLDNLLPADPTTFRWEAFDPGLGALYTGNKGTKMSSREWKHRTGAAQQTREANQRNLAIKAILEETSRASLKTGAASDLQARLLTWVGTWDAQWAHFGAKWWTRQRLLYHQKKQRALDHIADTVLGKDHSKVAVFGDAFYPGATRGRAPGPVTAVRNYLAKKGRVVLVNEFRTSCVCSQCDARMNRHREIHALFHCNNNGCNRTWNRDVNASWNIGRCFVAHMRGKDRPSALQRTS
jgi:hypothetical protein